MRYSRAAVPNIPTFKLDAIVSKLLFRNTAEIMKKTQMITTPIMTATIRATTSAPMSSTPVGGSKPGGGGSPMNTATALKTSTKKTTNPIIAVMTEIDQATQALIRSTISKAGVPN